MQTNTGSQVLVITNRVKYSNAQESES